MTMKVKEEIHYVVGELKCPKCGETHQILCLPKKDNQKYKSNRHRVI